MTAPDTEQQLLAELSALQVAGQHQYDPVGFVFMTKLAQRLPSQTAPVRRLLADKLGRELSQYREKLSQPPPAAMRQMNMPSPVIAVKRDTGLTPLAELNRYINGSASGNDDKAWTTVATNRSEMNSVRQFKQVWQRIQAEDQVAQAVLQGPKNPGPINSHMLVLRTLTLMRQLSPAYLQRFLAQSDALLCLDRATAKPLVTASKAKSRGRLKK